MIVLPRRSVTRFFIPLIDVLTVLFGMFLLMPIFDEKARSEQDDAPVSTGGLRKDLDNARLARLLEESQQTVQRLRKEQDPLTAAERAEMKILQADVQRLRNEARKPLQERVAVFVLGIDAKNGDLFYYDPLDANKKIALHTAVDARRLIDQQRDRAGDRELYFLFQEPRGKSRFPIGSQRKQYESWFQGVPHGFESPGGRP